MMNYSTIPFIRLREVLLDCGYFEDFRGLRGFFTSHSELTQMWQEDLSPAENMEKQIDQIIDFLRNQKSRISSDDGENGLILFLRVLAERLFEYNDPAHPKVEGVLDELEALGASPALGAPDSFADSQAFGTSEAFAPSQAFAPAEGFGVLQAFAPSEGFGVSPAFAPSESFGTSEAFTPSEFEAPAALYTNPDPYPSVYETQDYAAPPSKPQSTSYAPAKPSFTTSYGNITSPALSTAQPIPAVGSEWLQYAPTVGVVVVPRITNGQLEQVRNGLGWLVTPNLLLTCWHVVEANRYSNHSFEPNDLLLHLANTFVLFESTYSAEETKYRVQRLEYYNPKLDYVLLRLKDRTDRPLLERGLLNIDKTYLFTKQSKLLIIQHPKVRSQKTVKATYIKQVAKSQRILYQAASAPSISGAPVINENSTEVVALHHGQNGSRQQHKATRLSAILSDLQKNKIDLYQAIMSVWR